MELNDQNNVQLTTVEISDKIQTLKKSKRSAPKTCVKVSKGNNGSGGIADGKSKKSSKSSQLFQTKPKSKSKNSQTSDLTLNLVEVLDNEIESDVPERPRSRSSQHSSTQKAPSESLTVASKNVVNNLETDCSQHYDSHVHISPSRNLQKRSKTSSKTKKRKAAKPNDGEMLENREMSGCSTDLVKDTKVPKKLKDSLKKKRKIDNRASQEEKPIGLIGRSASPTMDGALSHTFPEHSKMKMVKLSKKDPSIKNKKQSSNKRKRTESFENESTNKKCLDSKELAETTSSPNARSDSLYQSVDNSTATQQNKTHQKLSKKDDKKMQYLKEKKQKIVTPRIVKHETVKESHIYKKKNASASLRRKNATTGKSKTSGVKKSNNKKKISFGRKQKTIAKNIKDARKRNKTTPKKKNKVRGVAKKKTTNKRKNTIPKRKT